jgi:hypothetical protein
MSLGLSIDTVDFDRLVAEAQRRIAPRSRGEWTLHGPVDPGMTLIELYAWLLDQRSFLADQVSEPLGRALLALLGDAARPAGLARTVLAIEPDHALVVPRRTGLRPVRAGLPLTFTTDESIAAAPLLDGGPGAPAIEIATFEAARAAVRRGAALLPAHGGAGSASIALRFAEALPVGAWLGVFIDLEGSVAPEWSPDAAGAPPPAALGFRRRGPAGEEAFAPADLRDGTGGLRRSGIVRARVTPDWARPGPAGGWQYELVIATSAATFTAPPRLRAIAASAVAASHRHWRCMPVDASGLAPISGQVVRIPLDEGSPLEGSIRLQLDEADGARHVWRPAAGLDRRGPGDRVFEVDRARGQLRFGDGLHGRAPYPAAGGSARVAFQVGGGAAGNIGRVAWTGSVAGGPGIRASNPVAAVGGRDPETFDDARSRVAAGLARPTRAVTAADHVAIAVRTPGVAVGRAHAAIGSDAICPGRRSPGVSTVYVVPDAPARAADGVRAGTAITAPRPDPGLLAAVQRQLSGARLLGHRIVAAPVAYRPVTVDLSIDVDPYDATALRRRMAGAIRLHLDPLLGGDEGLGWPFGAPLLPSDLLRVAQQALDDGGDGGSVVQVRIGTGGALAGPCENVDLADHELPEVADVIVRLIRATSGGIA